VLQAQSAGGAFVTSAGGNAMTFAFSVSDRPGGGPAGPPNQEREFAMSTVNVAGEDISGVVLTGMRGAFANATGLTLDLTARGMGVRSNRYSMLVKDGKVASLNIEAPGKFEVSDADTLLAQARG